MLSRLSLYSDSVKWEGSACTTEVHYSSLNNRVEGRKRVRRYRNKLQKYDNSNMKVYGLWSLYFELELFF